jgi:hypothetical protein
MNVLLKSAISRILRPLARIMLRYGVSYGEFAEIARQIFVTAADEDFPLTGRKQSVSRIAVLTGLSRKEVSRLRGQTGLIVEQTSYNRGVRIISGWNRDPEFLDESGNPMSLDTEGQESSFALLVKRYSGDIPTRAALDELLRVGAIRRDSDGKIHLNSESAYVPSDDKDAQFQILGASVSDLLGTIDYNLEAEPGTTRLQLTTAYDNLPRAAVDNFRALSRQEARLLLKKMDEWLAEHDRDSTDEIQGEGRVRAGIGIYYIEQEIDT